MAVLICVPAWAQYGAVYSPQTTVILPVTIPANTSTNISDVTLDVRKQKKVGIYVAIQGDDTGTNGVCTFTFARSVDGVNFQSLSTQRPTVTLAANGVTLTSKIVELDTFGTGYFKLVSINNDDNVGLTNVVLKYGIKLNTP
jgi:hypothetical protein